MTKGQIAKLALMGLSVFALVFTLVEAVYGSIAADRWVEQGICANPPVSPTALAVALIFSALSVIFEARKSARVQRGLAK